MLGTKVRDITAGFRVYRVSLLEKLDLTGIAAHGYSFQIEMAWRCLQAGAKVVEVPITFVERVHGHSKMSLKIVLEAMYLVTRWGIVRFIRGN
jgi:dolichol-phosphate mannosyltransferase